MATVPPYTTLRDRLHALAEETLRGSEIILLDVRVRGAKGRTIVDVIADTPDGIGIDELTKLSRELGFAIDTHEVIPGAYTLSALSPGAKEPLHRHQYPRHVGRTLDVQLVSDSDDAPGETVRGVLQSVNEDGIVLELSDATPRSLTFDTIQQARVVLPW